MSQFQRVVSLIPFREIRTQEVLAQALDQEEDRIVNLVLASSMRGLSRYGLRVGKKYGHAPGRPRFEIKDFFRDQVIYKDLSSGKVFNKDVDDLLNEWESKAIYEVTPLDEILETINKYVTPLIGVGMGAALISWLMGKIK